jgi:hypothetical protein
MSDLPDRLAEVMHAMHWSHSDLMRVSKQSSSVVSQWLGKGSKSIKTIGKIEAALYIERESGFSALWIAKGIGPRMAHPHAAPVRANEAAPRYGAGLDDAEIVSQFGQLLGRVPSHMRIAVGDVLRGWAQDGGAADRIPAVLTLLGLHEKASRAA